MLKSERNRSQNDNDLGMVQLYIIFNDFHKTVSEAFQGVTFISDFSKKIIHHVDHWINNSYIIIIIPFFIWISIKNTSFSFI